MEPVQLCTQFHFPDTTPEQYSRITIFLMHISLKCVPCGLTHWGRATHKCVSKLTIIGPDNGLSPGRRQAIIWTNAGILLIRTLGTNFSEILSEIHSFSFKKIPLKMSSGKWRPFCLGLNVLIVILMQIARTKHSRCGCLWPMYNIWISFLGFCDFAKNICRQIDCWNPSSGKTGICLSYIPKAVDDPAMGGAYVLAAMILISSLGNI